MKKTETTKLQVDMDQEMFRRAKALAVLDGYTLTDVVHNLLEDYIEAQETKWLDKMSAKKLTKIREAQASGKTIDKAELLAMGNVEKLYDEIKKQ